jgi:hypothetical protein
MKKTLNKSVACVRIIKNYRKKVYKMDNNYDVPVTETPAVEGGKGLGIASLILSIAGFVVPCCGGTCSIVGLILALVSRAKNAGQLNGMAKVGLILSIIGIALGIIGGIASGVIVFISSLAGATGL